MIVAALLSAALACLRNFVRQAVVFTVNRMYKPIVATATPAYDQPNLYPYLSSNIRKGHTRMPETMPISRIVGAIWNTIHVSILLIPLVPRSIARDNPPVCRDRWNPKSIERR